MTIKTTIKSICPLPFSRTFWKVLCKLLSKYLWQSLFLVKSHAFSRFFWKPLDGCVWIIKIVFQKHLILDVKTTFRLQKPHCKHFWWKDIKNESCKCYLGKKRVESNVSSGVSIGLALSFWAPFFLGHLDRNLSTPEI